jgi:hypothetical protein
MANLKHFNSATGKWEEIKVSTKFKDLINTVKLTQDQNYVNIGITSYNPAEDVIFVYQNSTWLQKDQDYVVNGGLLRIESKDGSNWSNGDTFNFVVLKNVDKDDLPSADGSLIQNGSITIAKLASSLQTYINKTGTAELATVADDLSGAVNELSSQMSDIVQQKKVSIIAFPREINENDDAPRMQRLFNYCVTNNKIAELEHGATYVCNKQLTIDIGKICIEGNNAILDFTNFIVVSSTVPYAVLMNSTNTSINTQNNNYIRNIKIRGMAETIQDLTKVKQCCGLFLDTENTGTAVAHIDIDNVTINGFNWGIIYGNNTYIIRHYGLEIFHCGTGIYMGKGVFVNYGENINFVSSVIYECGTGVYNENNIGVFNIINSSIDYNATQIRTDNSSMVFITNSHIEGGALAFECDDTSMINIKNSWIVWPNTLTSQFIQGTSTQGITFDGCCFYGGYLNGNGHQLIENGTCLIRAYNSKFPTDNAFSKQLLNSVNSKVASKYFDGQISTSISNATTRWNCDQVTIEKDFANFNTGNYSYKITKKTSTAGGFLIALPKSEKYACIKFSIRASVASSATLHVQSGCANIYNPSASNNLIEYNNIVEHHWQTLSLTTSFADVVVDTSSTTTSDKWIFNFDLSSVASGITINIDSVELYEY